MKKIQLYSLLFFIGLLISGIQPKEYFTWFLEVLPAIIGFLILAFTYKNFRFTNFTYFFILIHCSISDQTCTHAQMFNSFCPNTTTQVNCTSQGSYCPVGSIAEQPCPTGHYCVNSATIMSCPLGTFSNITSASSVSTCNCCSAGTYCNTTGCAVCTECPANTVAL